ncbi:hypothetical protein BDD12DRAFT_829294 [Trichophaea hybrida]|nr:hypothetical protein BDD12DRAFT_829294 [Trichophaea hybrida]
MCVPQVVEVRSKLWAGPSFTNTTPTHSQITRNKYSAINKPIKAIIGLYSCRAGTLVPFYNLALCPGRGINELFCWAKKRPTTSRLGTAGTIYTIENQTWSRKQYIPRGKATTGNSGYQWIHWIVPILSGVPYANHLSSARVLRNHSFGWGFTTIFISLVIFVAEGYLEYSSSAIAATTILKSLFAASFPLFSMRMYNKLSPEWASSLLDMLSPRLPPWRESVDEKTGFVSIVFIPVPWLFWKFGPALRAKGKFYPGGRIEGGEIVISAKSEV